MIGSRVFVAGHCKFATVVERVPCGYRGLRFWVRFDDSRTLLVASSSAHPAEHIAIFPVEVWIKTAMRHANVEVQPPCA